MRKTAEALEAGTETFDIFWNAIRSQKATSYMLYLLLKQGDGCSEDMCEGISWMLEQQAELLEDIYESCEMKSDLMEEYSNRLEEVRKTEMNADGARDSEKVLGLRRQMIAEAVEHGAEAGEIAAAVNMRRANVEKVIRQLQGERPVPQAKAVNG